MKEIKTDKKEVEIKAKDRSETGVLRKRKKRISKLKRYNDEIKNLVKMGVSTRSIQRIINSKYNLEYFYTTYVHYIKNLMI